jgi:hypothetical protein
VTARASRAENPASGTAIFAARERVLRCAKGKSGKEKQQ